MVKSLQAPMETEAAVLLTETEELNTFIKYGTVLYLLFCIMILLSNKKI